MDKTSVIRKLNRVKRKRVATRRPVISKTENDLLFNDIQLREAELRDAEKDLEKFKLEINLATRIIRAILQNDKLSSLVPLEMRGDLERFAEIYI